MECSWIPRQEQVLPPKLEEAPQITVPLSVADPHHWNIVNDPIFPNCLATFKVRHEVSLASGAAASTGGASSQGGSSTPTQELPLATWLQPPSTPPLEWQEVDTRVTEVMDQVHDLHLQLLQEMGFVHEIDQALSKSLMVEFLRLKIIIKDDLSGALRTWQTDMEVATDKFLRDLDAVTQTSTTLPSKSTTVGVALRQFRAATQLRVALPLTRLDEAQEEMEKFIQSRLEELRSLQETKNLIGELSSRITDHRGRVHELLRSKPLRHPEVIPLIMVGLAADRPLKSNFFPGLLEGLLGSLGIAARGRVILPHLPVRVLAACGPQLCMRQSPKLSRGMLRHPELWGCLPTWTFVTRRVSSKRRGISYHQFSRTRSSSLRWLRLCSSWQSLRWCQRYFLWQIATWLCPLHLSQRAVGPNRGY